MTKYIRLGIGVLAGIVAGITVYEMLVNKRKEKKLAIPNVKKNNIVRFPASRPPYAEEAEAAAE